MPWPALPFGHQPCSVPSSNRSITTDESKCLSGLPPAPPSSKLSLCSLHFVAQLSHLPAPTSVTSPLTPPDQTGTPHRLPPCPLSLTPRSRVTCQLGTQNSDSILDGPGQPLAKASTFHTQKHRPILRSLAASSTAPSSVPSSVYDLNAGVTKTHLQALLCTELCPYKKNV